MRHQITNRIEDVKNKKKKETDSRNQNRESLATEQTDNNKGNRNKEVAKNNTEELLKEMQLSFQSKFDEKIGREEFKTLNAIVLDTNA